MSEVSAPAGGLLRLAQSQGAQPPPQYAAAHWVSYGSDEAILLAVVLLAVASGFAYAGKRLRTPVPSSGESPANLSFRRIEVQDLERPMAIDPSSNRWHDIARRLGIWRASVYRVLAA
jgi:hypothetical protein